MYTGQIEMYLVFMQNCAARVQGSRGQLASLPTACRWLFPPLWTGVCFLLQLSCIHVSFAHPLK